MGKKKDNEVKPSKQEKALAKVAKKKFEVYKRLYRPLAKKQLERTAATEGRIKEAQGIVNADIQQSSAGADQGLARAGLASGVRGSSNRSVLARAQGQRGIGLASGAGQALAREGVEQRERAGKLAHIDLGHGIARGTVASQTQLAGQATRAALQQAEIDIAKSNQLATTLGQGFGAYTGFGGEWGTPGGGSSRPQFATYQLNSGGRSMR